MRERVFPFILSCTHFCKYGHRYYFTYLDIKGTMACRHDLAPSHTHAHAHTHTERERERERDKENLFIRIKLQWKISVSVLRRAKAYYKIKLSAIKLSPFLATLSHTSFCWPNYKEPRDKCVTEMESTSTPCSFPIDRTSSDVS